MSDIIQAIDLVSKGQRVKRCRLPVGIEIDNTVIWLGEDAKEAMLTVDTQEEKFENVWGVSRNEIMSIEFSIEFAPFTLRGGAQGQPSLSDVQVKLINSMLNKDYDGFKFPVIVCFGFSGKDGEFTAVRYNASQILPQSIGGSAMVDMPVKITLAGSMDVGTVDGIPPEHDTAVFTKTVDPEVFDG